MQYTKFQAPEPSGSEDENFYEYCLRIFVYVILWFKPRIHGIFWIRIFWTFIWTNFIKDHSAMLSPNFKHQSKVVLKKKIIKCFSMYFYGSDPGPPGIGQFLTLRSSSEETWFGPPGLAAYRISRAWAKLLWRRKFQNVFLCILMVQTWDPLA